MQDDGQFQEYLCNSYLSPSHAYHPPHLHGHHNLTTPQSLRSCAKNPAFGCADPTWPWFWAQSTTGPISELEYQQETMFQGEKKSVPFVLDSCSACTQSFLGPSFVHWRAFLMPCLGGQELAYEGEEVRFAVPCPCSVGP